MADSLALTRRDGNVASSSDVFTQQGTVEWTNIANFTFTASLALLGRLASAGIEPRTVAVAQAICSNLKLGPVGERRLHDCLSKLKAFSSASSLLWFGLGVRHIVRTLTQTTQGASCVALCAALAETYHVDVAGLVLMELASRYQAPQDLSPSFLQWQALVRSCAGIFKSSSFGLKVHTLKTLNRGHVHSQSACLPADLAEIIYEISAVKNGIKRGITVVGDGNCAWIVVFAEWLLDLRVRIESEDGELVYTNYDGPELEAQILVRYDSSNLTGGLQKRGETYILRDGSDIIQRTLGANSNYWLASRCEWKHILSNTLDSATLSSLLAAGGQVAAFFNAAAAVICDDPEASSYSGPGMDYLQSRFRILNDIIKRFPELQPIERYFRPEKRSKDLVEAYKQALPTLLRLCGCDDCTAQRGNAFKLCIFTVLRFILIVCHQLSYTTFEAPLLPSVRGFRHMLHTLPSFEARDIESLVTKAEADDVTYKLSLGIPSRLGNSFCLRFYMILYTGHLPFQIQGLESNEFICAYAWNGLCVYSQALIGISDKYMQLCRVHITPGEIECGSEPRDAVWGYFAPDELSDGLSQLIPVTAEVLTQRQFHPVHVKAEMVLRNFVNLEVAYRLSDGKKTVWVNPAFLTGAWSPLLLALAPSWARQNSIPLDPSPHCGHRQERLADHISSFADDQFESWMLNKLGSVPQLAGRGPKFVYQLLQTPVARCAAIVAAELALICGSVKYILVQDLCLTCVRKAISDIWSHEDRTIVFVI